MAEFTIPLYDLSGNSKQNISLDAAIFGIDPNPTLVHQAVQSYLANRRAGTAHAKDRSEVSGGGKKPWKQKGTGHARAGSSRSPLWRGGGVTFGPLSIRNFSKRMPQKMRQQALRVALSAKVASEHIIIIDSLESLDGKTRSWVTARQALPMSSEGALVVSASQLETAERSIRNISGEKYVSAEGMSLYDIIRHPVLILTKDTLSVLANRLASKTSPVVTDSEKAHV